MKTFFHSIRVAVSFSLAGLAFLLAVAVRGADVSFYAVYKQQKFIQNDAGQPTQSGVGNPFRFGATVSSAKPGSVLSATLSAPGGASQALDYNAEDDVFEGQKRFTTENALDAAFVSGTYTFNVNTLHDGLRTLKLNLPSGTYPNAPHISDFVAAQSINAGADFKLTWDPLAGGTANDYILFVMGDIATGQILFRTPDPFKSGALDGTDTSVVIPANTLSAGQNYAAGLSFYRVKNVEMAAYPGAVGVVAYGCSSDFNIATAVNSVLFNFSFRHFANGGTFDGSTNAVGTFPVTINGYRADLTVLKDVNYPPAAAVFFTGPPGSGLTNAPADPQATTINADGGFYFSPKPSEPLGAPAGTWLVNYKGNVQSFPAPDPENSSRLVVPLPVVTLSNDILMSVRWSFWDPNGASLPAGAPGFLTSMRVQAFDSTNTLIYDSNPFSPTLANHTLKSLVNWSKVDRLRMLYGDDLGKTNTYAISFIKTPPKIAIQLASIAYLPNGGFQLRLAAEANHSYLLQTSTDLARWTDLFTTNLLSRAIIFTDTQSANSKYRFYRAELTN